MGDVCSVAKRASRPSLWQGVGGRDDTHCRTSERTFGCDGQKRNGVVGWVDTDTSTDGRGVKVLDKMRCDWKWKCGW